MLKKWRYLFLIVSLTSFSCSEYQKVLKSTDINYKYTMAVRYYEEKKHDRALPLFEELIPLLRGSNKAEKAYYYYCYSNFNLDYLYTAAYHFKKFASDYPNSKNTEESLFMSGYSHYLISPSPGLDQSDTYKAINALQLFINTYPENPLVDSSNVLMDKLRTKLEEKFYLNAKQYYKIFDYKAAIVALNNLLRDYPETEKREEITFLILKSHYLLTINSIKKKKMERIDDTIDAYYTFVDSFEKSRRLKEAENIYKKMSEEKERIKLEPL